MTMQMYQAFVMEETDGRYAGTVRTLGPEDLPAGELDIRVSWSSVNYKDALACSGRGNIVASYPFVPGIDLAGTVTASRDSRFREGDPVLVTGYGLGVRHYGGFSEMARVPADWAVPLPSGLSLQEAMILGTAGFTAALSVIALETSGVRPDGGPVLVTGASGGVGSLSIAMLAKRGYEVAASSGKAEFAPELRRLGAARVIPRSELVPAEPRPLHKQEWAGAVDCVGGTTLAYLLSSLRYGGAAAACGLTGGAELPATVYPFILRGIRLIGIDSVYVPMPERRAVWERLGGDLKPEGLESLASEIRLEHLPETVNRMLEGSLSGRTIVRL